MSRREQRTPAAGYFLNIGIGYEWPFSINAIFQNVRKTDEVITEAPM